MHYFPLDHNVQFFLFEHNINVFMLIFVQLLKKWEARERKKSREYEKEKERDEDRKKEEVDNICIFLHF